MAGFASVTNVDGIRFSVGEARFRELLPEHTDRKTTDDEILILKTLPFLKSYDAIFSSLPNGNVVEFGIAEAGSIIYLALAFPNMRFVGIDIRRETPAVLRWVDRLGIADRVKLCYGVDQSDASTVNKIITETFGNEHVGMIIDDASHLYELSKATFEITFPRLAKGGVYSLEDWNWSHTEPFQANDSQWSNEPALSNLVFRFAMLMPSLRGVIEKIEILPHFTAIRRGSAPLTSINVDRDIKARGKALPLI